MEMMQATVKRQEGSGGEVRVEVVREAECWAAMQGEWNELFAQSPGAATPMRFAWLWEWWRVYGSRYGAGAAALRIVTVRRGEKLIGALPLYVGEQRAPLVRMRRLGLVSTGEAEWEETCPDGMDLLHAAGEEDACLAAVARWLEEERDWDVLDLPDVGAGSPLTRLGEHLGRVRMQILPRGVCPLADISGGLDAYFSRISANARQQARRLLRGAGRAGVRFEAPTEAAAVEECFAQMIRLHQARWRGEGQAGCFAAERFTDFHRALVRRWAGEGKAVLARLSLEGEPLAVLYGFVNGRKFDFYQSGVALETERVRSPGIVAFLMLFEHLAGRGIATFDFLRGSSEYKQRLATGESPLVRVRAVRRGVRAGAFAAASLGQRVVRRVAKRGSAECRVPSAESAEKTAAEAASTKIPPVGTPATLGAYGARRKRTLAGVLKQAIYAAYLYCGYVQVRDWVLGRMGKARAVVLYYHRVGEADGLTRSVEDFRRDLAYLKRHYECIGLAELCRRLRENEPMRRGVAVVTFDDGYRDNFTHALPALREAGVPATFFVSTGFIGTSREFPHDVRAGARGLATLTWDEVRAMQEAGFEIGSHTVNHADLGRVDEPTTRREVLESLAALNRELGERARPFAFPWGKPANLSKEAIKLAGEAGHYTVASAYGGSNSRGDDAGHIRRMDAGNGHMNRLCWRARLAGLDPDYQRARRLLACWLERTSDVRC